MNPQGIPDGLRSRLKSVRHKAGIAAALHGAALSGLVLIVVLLVTLLAEEQLYLGTGARTIIFYLLLALAAILFLWRVAAPLGRLAGLIPSETDVSTAKRIGNAFPGIKDRLVNGLQLMDERPTTTIASKELIDASFDDLTKAIEGVDFLSTVDYAGPRRMVTLCIAMALACALLCATFPAAFLGAADRILRHSTPFAAPAPFAITVEPGDLEIIKGETVIVRVQVKGATVPDVTLAIRPEGQEADEERTLQSGAGGIFRHQLTGVKTTTKYSARSRGVQSAVFTITVTDRPLVKVLRIVVTPPAYSRVPGRTQEDNMGDVAALRGTRVSISVEANKNLRDAALIMSDSAVVPLAVHGRQAAGSMTLMKDRTYHILLHDSAGTPSADPVEYTMRIMPDAFPSASILVPGADLDIADNGSVPLEVKINDDYGFSGLRLGYKLVQSRYEKPAEEFTFTQLPMPPGGSTEALVRYAWNTGALHLVPEDVVTYFVEVFDNDAVTGPKSSLSEFYSLRLPSMEEVFADADAKHDMSVEQMTKALNQAREARKDLDQIQKELQQSRNKVDWQEKTRTESMLKKYEDAQRQMDGMLSQVEKMLADLQKNQALSKETVQKYEELQRMMQELASPEFAEALERLRQSLEQLSPEAMKQALREFTFSEENFRQSIERTMNLLKRIQIEQKVDEAIRRTEEMIKGQETLQEKTESASGEDTEGMEELARDQSVIQEKRAALQRELAELRKKMEEFPAEMPLTEMAKSEKELAEGGMEKEIAESAKHLQASQPQRASQAQERASGAMKSLAQQLRQMQQALQRTQQRQIVNEMRRAMDDLLELSRRQEALKNGTQALEENSREFRENAQGQMDVMRDLGGVTERLAGLSQKTFSITPEMGKSIGDALRSMDDAMHALDQRDRGSAVQKQINAMGMLNESAQRIQSAMNAIMQGGGQGMGMTGLMQRLQRMSAQQQGINDGSRMIGGMTPEQAASVARLAAEQGIVRKSLEQLAKEAAASGDLSKMLGDLNRAVQEMREVQTDLAGGNVNPETLQKQDRILSRLLDAQRSARERDFEKQRKATAGQSIRRTSPLAIDLTTQEGRNRLRRDLQKALEGGYARDYEDVIKRYFDVLEQYDNSTK